MKGYYKPFIMPDPTPEEVVLLVGCNRCRIVWHERTTMPKGCARINSAAYIYDYCDSCKTKEDGPSVTTKETK